MTVLQVCSSVVLHRRYTIGPRVGDKPRIINFQPTNNSFTHILREQQRDGFPCELVVSSIDCRHWNETRERRSSLARNFWRDTSPSYLTPSPWVRDIRERWVEKYTDCPTVRFVGKGITIFIRSTIIIIDGLSYHSCCFTLVLSDCDS